MRRTGLYIILLAGFLLPSCAAFEKKQKAGAAVELNGQYLYRSTLDSLTLGLDPVDSTRVVQQYTGQWAQDVLLYDKARKRSNKEIERLVEDYRRTLYVHLYEEYTWSAGFPKE